MQSTVTCSISVDGNFLTVEVAVGSTVQQAVESASLTLSNLDRIDPPTYTLITAPLRITITRVRESFDIEEVTVPFAQQKVRNESLPQGQTILVQPGVNGTQQVTYRRIFENGIERSRVEVKRATITEPKPEIIMVGIQAPFTAVAIPNRLAYLAGGYAWVMQRTTGDRQVLNNAADLDGRIFSLSPDGKWLLYTKKSQKALDKEINTLWVISTTDPSAKPVDLKISNIIHFADWSPSASYQIFYSTVEPRASTPGWQANNDLYALTFTPTGIVGRKDEIIAPNSGGIYGWWGTQYSISPNGKQIAYAQPDTLGIINLEKKSAAPLLMILPYQTRADWAWIPGFAWSPDSATLISSYHLDKTQQLIDESSPIFNLIAVNPTTRQIFPFLQETGMFSYPVISPRRNDKSYAIAFLQSISPTQSDTSRYQLGILDRDGSNRQILFPSPDAPGLEPQKVVWSPPFSADATMRIALVYQGNIWFINHATGQAQQVTGDNLITRIDWK